MAIQYKFQDCLESELSTIAIVPGTILVCRDTGAIFYDNLEGDRISNKDIVVYETEEDRLDNLTPSNDKQYVVKETKKVYMYIGGSWISLNEDPDHVVIYINVASNTSITISHSGLKIGKSYKFIPDSSIKDLFPNTDNLAISITTNGTATITNSGSYEFIGMLVNE